MNIKTWQERMNSEGLAPFDALCEKDVYMQEEITELRKCSSSMENAISIVLGSTLDAWQRKILEAALWEDLQNTLDMPCSLSYSTSIPTAQPTKHKEHNMSTIRKMFKEAFTKEAIMSLLTGQLTKKQLAELSDYEIEQYVNFDNKGGRYDTQFTREQARRMNREQLMEQINLDAEEGRYNNTSYSAEYDKRVRSA